MKKPTQRMLQVIRKQRITPNMLRVTLGGDDMADFPEGRESANCKLFLPSLDEQPVVRTYTVRSFRVDTLEVDIDFVLHCEHGPASDWALSTQVGETIGFGGPGSAKTVDFDADWFFLAGDMSALPAISANIEKLPRDAKGYAVLEIIHELDKQALDFPPGLEVQWVNNPEPNTPSTALYDAVVSKPWHRGRAGVWVAGESGMLRQLRRYFKQERGVEKADLYASGYWQIGLTEDIHQQLKRQEVE